MTDRLRARLATAGLVAGYAGTTALSHPDAAVSVLAWASLVPLLALVHGSSGLLRTARVAWLAGFLGYFGTVGWLCTVGEYSGLGQPWGWVAGVVGAVTLAAYMALYVSLFAVLITTLLRPGAWWYPVAAATLWTFCEWLRSWIITGFPWSALGYTQWNSLGVAQLSRLGGVDLVTFVLALVNATIFTALVGARENDRKALWTACAPTIAILIGVAGYAIRSAALEPATGPTVRVAVVPGNIPQDERWDRESLPTNLRAYIALLELAAESEPDFIVMPETAIPYPYLSAEDQALFVGFAKRTGVPILFGAPRVDRDPSTGRRMAYNGAMALRPDGSFSKPYDKRHLVPFGEYIPLRRYMPDFLERIVGVGDQQPGSELVLLPVDTPAATVFAGVPICFESVFPEIAREFAKAGANLMVVITNDGWYDDTAAIAQHNAFSVFRAIETGRTLVRAANRGVSCVIDANGRTRKATIAPTDRGGIIVEDVPLLTGATFYVRAGSWVAVLCAAATAAMVAGHAYRRLRRTATAAGEPHQ